MNARTMLLAIAATATLATPAFGQETQDLAGALKTLDPILASVTTRCPVGEPLSQPWLVSAIVATGAQLNPFAEIVAPIAPPAGSKIIGYQQYRLYDSDKVAGHFIWHTTFPALPVSNSDTLNGIDARYQVDLHAVSYRTWDMNKRLWGEWTTKGSLGNDVHFARFIIERRNGVWNPHGKIYMQPVGTILQGVNCDAIPPLK